MDKNATREPRPKFESFFLSVDAHLRPTLLDGPCKGEHKKTGPNLSYLDLLTPNTNLRCMQLDLLATSTGDLSIRESIGVVDQHLLEAARALEQR